MTEYTLWKVEFPGIETELATARTKDLLLLERDERQDTVKRRASVLYRVTDDEGQEVEWDD